MPNLLDYIEWRGDLTFDQAPLNEVDNLIFCLLSYVDLDGIVPGVKGLILNDKQVIHPEQRRMTLRSAAAEYFLTRPTCSRHPLGFIIPADILTLFRHAAQAPRYREIELTGYVNRISDKRACQFSALTFHLPGDVVFVAFRGTDDTITGWKEDLNLSVMDEIPAQRMAADYLNDLDMTPDTRLTVGGHSKGGNLAVWGAVHANASIRERIQAVYSNDGPGFSEGTTHSESYQALRPRIHLLLPEDSLVGLLLEQETTYRVVKSKRRGFGQHDGLSWEVLGGSFLTAESLSPLGLRHKNVLCDRIATLPVSRRREYIRLLSNLLEATGAETLMQLYQNKGRVILSFMKAYRALSESDRNALSALRDTVFSNKADTALCTEPTGHHRSRGNIGVQLFPLSSR